MKLADLLNDKSNSSKDASPEKSPLTSYNISNTKPSEAYPRTTKDHSSSLEELSRASKALISPTLDSKSSRTLAQPSFLGSRSLQDLSQYNDRARNSHIRSHGPMGTRSVSFSGTDSIPNYDHETKNHMARSTYNKQYDQFTPNYNTHSDYSIATLPPCDRTHQSYTSYHNRINNAGGSSPSMNRFPPLLTLRSRNHSLETTATSVSVNSADLPLTPMLTSSYASQKYSNHHDDKNSVHIEVIEAPPIRKKQPKRSKASNTTWTSEDDSQLIDMVLSTLPRQNYASYATRLSKRDSQSVRYRWKRLIKKFKGDRKLTTSFILLNHS